MESLIKRQNTFSGLPEWHHAGFTGKGQVVWNMESPTDHGQQTHNRVLDAAPDAEVLSYHNSVITDYKTIELDEVDAPSKPTTEEFIKAKGVGILTKSFGGSAGVETAYSRMLLACRDKYNLAIFGAAGNSGSEGAGSNIPDNVAIWVGACGWNGQEELKAHHYSGIGREDCEDVDFCTFTGGFNFGTSFASPHLAGIAAVIRQRLGELTQEELCTYFKTYAQPLPTDYFNPESGYDRKSGWGVAKLPPLSKRYISLTIGHRQYKVNGELKSMDTAPLIKDARTFVPIAFIARELGAEVNWDGTLNLVRIRKGSKTTTLGTGIKTYTVNGKSYEMDTAPFIKDRRTFVPISFIAKEMGCVVEWVGKHHRVNILEV